MAEPSPQSDHPHEPEGAAAVSRNARNGLILFFLYLLLYGGFMGLNVYDPALMARPFVAGVNLAICYGFGLIVAALLLAAVYMYLCRDGAGEGGR